MDVNICLNKCNKCETSRTDDGIIKDCPAWHKAMEKLYIGRDYINCGESFASIIIKVDAPDWCPFFLEHLVTKK